MNRLGTIHILRQQRTGRVQKMANFAIFQYCIYADFTRLLDGWVTKKNVGVIYGWSFRKHKWNASETKFSKSSGEIRNHNILMAVMKPPDCLKWPETLQSWPG